MLVQLQDDFSSMIWDILPKEWLVRLLGGVSILFGFTALVATLFDLLSIMTAHIAIIATCFRAMHQSQLYLLAALWRLFRGKKKNVLRHRTDTMEYDSMQLLLGMILFTAVIFLFTTILVYYAFFAMLDVTIRLVAVILWLSYILGRFNPMGKCILRARHPGWFTERLYLVEDTKLSSDSRPVTHLEMVPRSFSSLVAESLSPYLTPLGRCIPLLLWEFISGASCSLYQECLRSLTRPSVSVNGT
jgi:phosphatidylinositol glycan class Q protein